MISLLCCPTSIRSTHLDQAVLGGELSFDVSAYSLSRDDPGTPYDTINHGTDQTRAVANINWQKQMTTGAGQVITPFAKMRSDLYITNNLPDGVGGFQDEEVTGRILPSAGIDLRWPFIASYDFGQSILTPVFQAIAATNETDEDKIGNEDAISVNFDSSSLFLHDRFTGYDRYEGGTRANVGLLYSFLADNGGSVRMSLGESFHIAGENSFDLGSGLEGSKSDLVGAIRVPALGQSGAFVSGAGRRRPLQHQRPGGIRQFHPRQVFNLSWLYLSR